MDIKMRRQNEKIGALVKDFAERSVDYYNTLPEQPVCHPAGKKTMDALKRQTIPEEGRSVEKVYGEMIREAYSHVIPVQHPRSFSCVPSTASMISWLGDVMTSMYNPHAGCRINAPAADLIEKKLIRWMCDLAGYPEQSGGLFVSGGSMANLTALTAARDSRLSFEERSRAVVYVSDQTHSSVAKGLLVIGFRMDQIRKMTTDETFRMDAAALESAVTEDAAVGRKPFAVVASAGTTNTGSVDPLTEIAAVCRKYGMWMHVDGAFGASALLSGQQRKKLSGIKFSDSLSWDAHKWMMQTYSCSAVLIRDRSALVRSFAAHPEYLMDAETSADGVEFWDLGPELTRPARGLKLWITLQTLGSREMGRAVDHGCAMADLAEKLIRRLPGWEIVSPAQLGVLNFRYVPQAGRKGRNIAGINADPDVKSDAETDEINREISRRITEGGFAQIFTTELHARKVLRMCTIHPETTEEDIRETVSWLNEIACGLASGREESSAAC